jgi:WD40 repeat protein
MAPERLSRELKGDLDWIVLRALEKDRERRYGSAEALAADIHRHLDDEPVEAGPPSAWYQFGKFARRNRLALASASSIAVLLVAGVAVSTWQAARAAQERDRAIKAERRALEARHSLAVQAGAAYNAMAGEKLRAGEWPDALASLAASLRVDPENRVAYQKADEELFQKRAFCLDHLLPDQSEKVVLAAYPRALVQRDQGLRWLKHQMDEGSGTHVWQELHEDPKIVAPEDVRWLASPGGRYRMELHPDRLLIYEGPLTKKPPREVALSVLPSARKTAFSADGAFLAVASQTMTQVVDLRQAKVCWEFTNPAQVSHLAVCGHGDRIALASEPLPIGPSRTFKELQMADGRVTDIDTDGGACLMAAACPEIDARVLVVLGTMNEKTIDIRVRGGSATIKLGGEVLALHLAPETGMVTFLEMENERSLRLGRVNLQGSLTHVDWLHSYEAEGGMYWAPEKECYGFAQGGKLCLVTARHLKRVAGDSLLCFDLGTGSVARHDYDGLVARLSPASDAGVALVACLPLNPQLEQKGAYSFTRADMHLFDRTDADGRPTPVLKGVRMGTDMLCALSPDGKFFALGGPYPEQLSVHASSQGAALGFIRLTTEETTKTADGRTIHMSGPASLRSMMFESGDRLHVAFTSHRNSRAGVAAIACAGLKRPGADWSDLERSGTEDEVRLEASWGSAPSGAEPPEPLIMAGWSTCFTRAFFLGTQIKAPLRTGMIFMRDQHGGKEPVMWLENGFAVSHLKSLGSGDYLLIAGSPSAEAPGTNRLEPMQTRAQEGTALMLWNTQSGSLLSNEGKPSMEREDAPMIRLDGGVTAVAGASDSKTFAIGQNSGAVRLFQLSDPPADVLSSIGVPSPAGMQLEEIKTKLAPSVGAKVADMEFTYQDRALSVRYADGSLRLWDIKSLPPQEAPAPDLLADMLEACAGKAMHIEEARAADWHASVLSREDILARRQKAGVSNWSLGKRWGNFRPAWQARFFPWSKESDPVRSAVLWRRLADGPLAARVDLDQINFDYGDSGPEDRVTGVVKKGIIGTDHFGMIATANMHLERGRWELRVEADDGFRVFLNGKVLLEEWSYPHRGSRTVSFDQPEDGEVEWTVEHFENEGWAMMIFELKKS